MIIQYNCNGKVKSIPLEKVDKKYFPPMPEGPNITIEHSPGNLQYITSYISNSLSNECYEKQEAKRKQEELKIMEEREKQVELEKKQRRYSSSSSKPNPRFGLEYLLKNFSQCGYCRNWMSILTCSNPNCIAPSKYNISSTISDMRKLIDENDQLKSELEKLKEQLNANTNS
jgi:hypothetical protein